MLATDLEANGENTCHINAQCVGGILSKSGIVGEDSCKNTWKYHYQKPSERSKADTNFKYGKESLANTFLVSCTKIETDDRLSTLTDSLKRHSDELTYTGDDGHGSNS